MRNYKDMADAVFARRDEYVASVKRKKKIALNASLSLCSVCLAVLGAFGIWKSGVLTPDPNVIGTKPQSYTESAPSTLHSFGSNATSEGKYSETTEYVSGNSKPQNNSEVSSSPAEDSKPSATDPVEKPPSPSEKPNTPVVKPTLPIVKPTLPADTDAPGLDVKPTPDVPPTSGADRYPQTQTPVVTDPTEGDPNGDSAGSDEVPDTQVPAPPTIPPTTAQPTTKEPDFAVPDEPCCTEPCTQAPLEEPTDAPCGPETETPQGPTIATEPIETPETESPNARITIAGTLMDQYSQPVPGAVLGVFVNGRFVATQTTDANGQFCFTNIENEKDLSIWQHSVPKGYIADNPFGFYIPDGNFELGDIYGLWLYCEKID